jgi:hypothetical protein
VCSVYLVVVRAYANGSPTTGCAENKDNPPSSTIRHSSQIRRSTKVLGCPGTHDVEYACGLPSLRAELTQTSNLGHFYARLSKHFLVECVQSQALAGFTWRVVPDFPRIFPKFNCVQRAMIAPHDIKLGRQLGTLGTLHAARYSRR